MGDQVLLIDTTVIQIQTYSRLIIHNENVRI